MRAGAAHGEKTLREQLFAATMAGRALHHLAIGFGAAATATLARLHFRHLNLHGFAENGFFESQREVIAKVIALSGARSATALTATPKHVAKTKNLAEQIAQVHGRRV